MHPPAIEVFAARTLDDLPMADIVVLRGTALPSGELEEFEVLAAPLGKKTEDLRDIARGWRPWVVLDEQVRRVPAVVGYGVRLRPASTDATALTPVAISGALQIELEVGPVPAEYGGDASNQYVLSAFVKRLEDGEIISAPRITGRRGESARIRSTIPEPGGGESHLEMVFFVSEDGKRVSYSWTLTRDGEVVEAHSAKLEL